MTTRAELVEDDIPGKDELAGCDILADPSNVTLLVTKEDGSMAPGTTLGTLLTLNSWVAEAAKYAQIAEIRLLLVDEFKRRSTSLKHR